MYNAPYQTRYQVLFITDGEPTDGSTDSELRRRIGELINLAPGRVVLSTGYYGNHGPKAIEKLEDMARAGNGDFIDYGIGIMDFFRLVPSRRECVLTER